MSFEAQKNNSGVRAKLSLVNHVPRSLFFSFLPSDPVYSRSSERLNNPTTPPAATATARDAADANATRAEVAPPGNKEYRSFPGTRGEEATQSRNSRGHSRFLGRTRSWTARKRRSPQRTGNSDNESNSSGGSGGSRGDSPRRASAGMLGALQRSFRDRMKTNRCR